MKNPDKPRDFSSRAGTFMITATWILFLFILFSLFDYSILQRNNPNQNVVTVTNEHGREIVLQRNVHGHYVANGTINYQQVTFLLDTGATDIAVPESLADKIGLKKGYPITVKTANGNVKAYRTQLESVAIGDIVLYDLNATILSNMHGEEALLGMSFLKHFEIIQKRQQLNDKTIVWILSSQSFFLSQ